ncbi:MAG: hypothetical protein WBZ37_11725 [Mycobacterium sp.]
MAETAFGTQRAPATAGPAKAATVGLRAPGALIALVGGTYICAVLFTIAQWFAGFGTAPGSLDELRRMVSELRYGLTLYGFLTWVVVGAAFGLAAKRFARAAGGRWAATTTRIAAVVAAGYVILRYLVVAAPSSGHTTRIILNVVLGCT